MEKMFGPNRRTHSLQAHSSKCRRPASGASADPHRLWKPITTRSHPWRDPRHGVASGDFDVGEKALFDYEQPALAGSVSNPGQMPYVWS